MLSDPRGMARFRAASKVCAVTVVVVGASAVAGWLLGIPALKSVFPGLVTMKMNTALSFVLAGTSLGLAQARHRAGRWAALGCAAAVVAVGGLTLGQYLSGLDFGIDQALVGDPQALQTSHPGRMSMVTALNFFLLGGALVLSYSGVALRLAHLLALVAASITLLALIGFLYRAPSLYEIAGFTSIALHTTIAFVLLVLALLFARPDRGITAVFTGPGIQGLLLRRLLPPLVIVPIVVGWIRLAGEETGHYNAPFGVSIMAVAMVLISGILVGVTARSLGRVDRERGRVEESLRRAEAMAAVGELSAKVAHEINNPLTSLLGYLERIKTRVAEDPKSAEAAERVERSALRIRDLAKDLLSLARTSRMEMGPVRLPALLGESLRMLEPDLVKHGVRVEWKVPDSLAEIRGSGEHLQQVFSNIFINALHAMPSGGALTVEAAAGNGEVRVSVADTGVGIPPENLDRIFEPFYTTKPRGEGTGLGLAICQSVVSQHGGRIEVQSAVGKGTTFTVVLPVGRDEAHRPGGPVVLPTRPSPGAN